MSAWALRHENNSDTFLTLGPPRCLLPSQHRHPLRHATGRRVLVPFVPSSWGHAPCHEGRTGSGPPFVHGASSCRPLQGTVDRTFAILNPSPSRFASDHWLMTEQRWRTGLQRIPLDGPLGERRKAARNPNAERRRSDPMGADYVSREVMSQCLVSGRPGLPVSQNRS
jgi:hypothetical protein